MACSRSKERGGVDRYELTPTVLLLFPARATPTHRDLARVAGRPPRDLAHDSLCRSERAAPVRTELPKVRTERIVCVEARAAKEAAVQAAQGALLPPETVAERIDRSPIVAGAEHRTAGVEPFGTIGPGLECAEVVQRRDRTARGGEIPRRSSSHPV